MRNKLISLACRPSRLSQQLIVAETPCVSDKRNLYISMNRVSYTKALLIDGIAEWAQRIVNSRGVITAGGWTRSVATIAVVFIYKSVTTINYIVLYSSSLRLRNK